jgi:hypothetical protein
VFASPGRGYDAEWVAAQARVRDPGLPEEVAREMSVAAQQYLQAMGKLDAPELARRLLAERPCLGASPAAVVAKAAVDFCAKHKVQLRG